MPRSEVRSELDRIRHPFRVTIDRAKNPFNIGSIIRTAHSFLAKEIILVGTEPWYERAAMGMQRYENIVELPTERTFLWETQLPDDAVLIFGNEDEGCSPGILEAAEQVVAIPMFGINHSYPISVAAGIAMAEWARRYYEKGRCA